jgi:nicotinate-nucleotide pyrophosphorylase (carboxylating)
MIDHNVPRDRLVAELDRVITAALEEDIGAGDLTTLAVIPNQLRFRGAMVARQPMVVAGLEFARAIFLRCVPEAAIDLLVSEGGEVEAGVPLCRIEGPAQGLLVAERTALNLVQHLSGIATATRSYARLIEGTGCTLLDTRKTIPGLRLLAKYAARLGGAANHRLGLYDAVLIKDNHIAVCGGVGAAVRRCKQAGLPAIEVECDTIEQVIEALEAEPDAILLDNMSLEDLRTAVHLVSGKTPLEASGGVSLTTIRAIAETGVDYVSVGRMTQSAPAVDIGMDWL